MNKSGAGKSAKRLHIKQMVSSGANMGHCCVVFSVGVVVFVFMLAFVLVFWRSRVCVVLTLCFCAVCVPCWCCAGVVPQSTLVWCVGVGVVCVPVKVIECAGSGSVDHEPSRAACQRRGSFSEEAIEGFKGCPVRGGRGVLLGGVGGPSHISKKSQLDTRANRTTGEKDLDQVKRRSR